MHLMLLSMCLCTDLVISLSDIIFKFFGIVLASCPSFNACVLT